MDETSEGWETITDETHPNLHDAFETIGQDMGAGAGHKTTYSVPPEWAQHLDEVEAALATLPDGEFQTFCIGDAKEMTRIAARTPVLILAHAMLESFFMNWQKITK